MISEYILKLIGPIYFELYIAPIGTVPLFATVKKLMINVNIFCK